MNCPSIIAAILLSFFFLHTGHAQPSIPVSSPDSVAKEIRRQWPEVRLVRIEPQIADAILVAGLHEDIAALKRIGIMVEDPANEMPRGVIAAVRSEGGTTFEGFKAAFCARYREFDCEFDFDQDKLRQAFEIGTRIATALRKPPGPLYLLLSGSPITPTITAILGFDSAAGNFRVLSYAYPLDDMQEYDLLRHFDSTAHSYLPFSQRFPDDIPYLLSDSAERWAAVNHVLRQRTQRPLQPAPRSPAPESLIEKFEARWPELKLVEFDREIVEPVWKSEVSELVERLELIGTIATTAPLPDFDQIALRAVESREGKTFDGFRLLICKYYREYDCQRDFDPDALQQAFSLAGTISIRMKEMPSKLYLLLSRSPDGPQIHGLVGFNPYLPELHPIHYPFLLDAVTKKMLKQRYDSIVAPGDSAFQQSLAESFIDSLDVWSRLALRSLSTITDHLPPKQLHGFDFLWSRVEGEDRKEFGPILLVNKRVEGNPLWEDGGVDSLGIECRECASLGLTPPKVKRITRLTWKATLEISNQELFEKTLQTNAPLELTLRLFTEDIGISAGAVTITIIPDETVTDSR